MYRRLYPPPPPRCVNKLMEGPLGKSGQTICGFGEVWEGGGGVKWPYGLETLHKYEAKSSPNGVSSVEIPYNFVIEKRLNYKLYFKLGKSLL